MDDLALARTPTLTPPVTLKTQRLILRPWQTSDLKPFAEMNADSDVMRYYPSVLSTSESDELAEKISARLSENGWGFWALELKDNGEFIGFTGLNKPGYDLPCNPCVEVGWRLSKKHWGKGYATEAAQASLQFAFEELNLDSVVSFASAVNTASWRVMERIGMRNTHNNFNHPIIPAGSPLSDHVLYKIKRSDWER